MTAPIPPHLEDDFKKAVDDLAEVDKKLNASRQTTSSLEKLKTEKQEAVRSLERFLELVYKWKRDPSMPMPISANQKRRIEMPEYKAIIIPFLQSQPKSQAKSKEIRKEVSNKVGFEIGEDAISKALREMHKSPDIPVWQIQAGIYGYDESRATQLTI